LNRRIRNRTYGGVRGRGLVTPSYSIDIARSPPKKYPLLSIVNFKEINSHKDIGGGIIFLQ
jgi:hypothetical protein